LTGEDPPWSSSHYLEAEGWEEQPFFDSAWEGELATEPSTLCLSISPDALLPGHDGPVSFMSTPEKNWDCSLHSPLEYAALKPGLDFPVDVDPVSDYELCISNHSSLSFSDEQNMATDAAVSNDTAFSFKHQDSVPFDQSGWLLPQQSSSFISSLIPQPHCPSTSRLPAVVGHLQDQPLPANHGPSRVLLPRLQRLKCPQCQEHFFDESQLR
jgi:hypothetical protein